MSDLHFSLAEGPEPQSMTLSQLILEHMYLERVDCERGLEDGEAVRYALLADEINKRRAH